MNRIVTTRNVAGGGREWVYATKRMDAHPARWIDSNWAQIAIIVAVFALLCIRW
jgi:hypothetical protein